MSDNEESAVNTKRRSSTTKDELNDVPIEASPGEAFMIYIDMNTLSNKLKLLDYENEYLLKWKMKPISK